MDCHTSNFSRTKNVTREEQDVADEAYLVHGSGEDKGFATLSPNSIPQRAYDMADDDTDEYRPHSPSRAHVGPNPAHLGGGPPGVRPGPGPWGTPQPPGGGEEEEKRWEKDE